MAQTVVWTHIYVFKVVDSIGHSADASSAISCPQSLGTTREIGRYKGT
jgi:hypothetical protein